MAIKQEFESLISAIKVYTDYYGYGLERTITSPVTGNSVYATKLRFDAFNGKLYVIIDKIRDTWEIELYIEDDLQNRIYSDFVKSNENFVVVGKKVQAMLSKLPRNEFKNPTDESFLRNFDSSMLYILEKEFMGYFI